ncbi:MAG: NAD-dependent epimerase/dehydratase family protein [Enterocloster clostridioformis]
MLDEKRWISEEDIGTLNHVGLRSIRVPSKRAAGKPLCMCFEQKGADAVIVRPSQIMGPGIALHDERLHINMISQMMRGNQIVLKGDGIPRRSASSILRMRLPVCWPC